MTETVNSPTSSAHQVSTFEHRPFFELALRHGVRHGLIEPDKLTAISSDAPKGMVQIANTFGSAYLRAELEQARARLVFLVSLYLHQTSAGDLDQAARLIRDNTILTLSRGGSTLIRQLFALPEYPILGQFEQGRVEDFLDFWSRSKTIDDYRNALAQRTRHQAEIRLAKRLARWLGLPETIYQDQHCEADAVIRTALLIRIANPRKMEGFACFDQLGFAELLGKLRKKLPVKLAHLQGEFSADEQAMLKHLEQDITSHDFPLIADPGLSLDQLVGRLKGRYFIRDQDIDDTSAYDALVAKEWTRRTKGKTDIDAILTLLLCIAAQQPGKVSLSESAGRTLIRKLRKDGLHPELARNFVLEHAPHEKQESLLEDWQDFFEQAEEYLLDEWDHDLHIAMKFLRENCYIEKTGRAKSA